MSILNYQLPSPNFLIINILFIAIGWFRLVFWCLEACLLLILHFFLHLAHFRFELARGFINWHNKINYQFIQQIKAK